MCGDKSGDFECGYWRLKAWGKILSRLHRLHNTFAEQMCSENWPFFLLLWVGWVEGFNINVNGMQVSQSLSISRRSKCSPQIWQKTKILLECGMHPIGRKDWSCVWFLWLFLWLSLNNAYSLYFFWSLLCFTIGRVYFYFQVVNCKYTELGVCLQINYMWLQKARNSMFFELGLNVSGLGLMIFHKMSPRTHHNYL